MGKEGSIFRKIITERKDGVPSPFYLAAGEFQDHCLSPKASADSIRKGYKHLEDATAEEFKGGVNPASLMVRYSMLMLNASTAQMGARKLGNEALAQEFDGKMEELREAIFAMTKPLDRMKENLARSKKSE